MRKTRSGISAVLFALAVAAPVLVAGTTAPRPSVPFLEDDSPKAMALARAKKLPIFVEAWAPW